MYDTTLLDIVVHSFTGPIPWQHHAVVHLRQQQHEEEIRPSSYIHVTTFLHHKENS